MSYLNPPYPNNFQELCAAMPLFYLDVFEMRAILRAQGHLLDGVCGSIENVVDFNFILTADDTTIRMWEKALKITYKSKLTLEQRKHIIIGYIIGLGHIGEQEIRRIIGQYTPNHVDFDFMRGTISILVEGEIPGEDNLLETLLRRIPAHLGLKISIHIRRQYRYTILFSHGGAVGSYFLLEPPIPMESIQTAFSFSYGGKIHLKLDGRDIPVPERTERMNYELWHGSTSTSDISGDTPTVKEVAASRRKAAGGLFCHTHIKSKRIE